MILMNFAGFFGVDPDNYEFCPARE